MPQQWLAHCAPSLGTEIQDVGLYRPHQPGQEDKAHIVILPGNAAKEHTCSVPEIQYLWLRKRLFMLESQYL